jgi:hypothetical protein
LNIFNPSMSGTEILLPKTCSELKIRTALTVHPSSPSQYVTVQPSSPSHFLTDSPSPLHHSHSPWRNLCSRHAVMTVVQLSSRAMLRN